MSAVLSLESLKPQVGGLVFSLRLPFCVPAASTSVTQAVEPGSGESACDEVPAWRGRPSASFSQRSCSAT